MLRKPHKIKDFATAEDLIIFSKRSTFIFQFFPFLPRFHVSESVSGRNSTCKQKTMNKQKYTAEDLKGIREWNYDNRKLRWCWERSIDGKRIRTYFSTVDEAVRCKKLAEDESRKGADQRKVFRAAAMREYENAKAIVGEGISLVDVALFWRQHEHLRESKSKHRIRVSDLITEVLDHLERRCVSKRSLDNSKYVYRIFAEGFGSKYLDEITGRELTTWLANLQFSPTSIDTIKSKVVFALNRALSLEYIDKMPKIDDAILPKIQKTPVETITITQVRELFGLLLEKHPRYVANYALRAFCGLRTAEAARMRWEYIDFDRKRIVIPAEVCKTRDDWVLQSPMLPETVFRWLSMVPQSHRKGRICAPNGKYTDYIVSGLPWPWPSNCLRHTFCTMHISMEGSADKTALLLRHRGTNMLYQHYLAKLVPKEEAEEFFGLSPNL